MLVSTFYSNCSHCCLIVWLKRVLFRFFSRLYFPPSSLSTADCSGPLLLIHNTTFVLVQITLKLISILHGFACCVDTHGDPDINIWFITFITAFFCVFVFFFVFFKYCTIHNKLSALQNKIKHIKNKRLTILFTSPFCFAFSYPITSLLFFLQSLTNAFNCRFLSVAF